MKKLIILCTVLIGFIAFSAMIADTVPEFKFEEESHDFGKIPQNKPVSVDFKFTNIGDQPLIISAVEPTCGCTIAKFTATPVKKGETGSITLTYNAAVVGTFNKIAQIKSNSRLPVKTIYLKGEVIEAKPAE